MQAGVQHVCVAAKPVLRQHAADFGRIASCNGNVSSALYSQPAMANCLWDVRASSNSGMKPEALIV